MLTHIKTMENIWKIIISATVSFVYVFTLSKILGKKQIAQLDFISYVNGITIGSIAAEMATELDDKPLYIYLISMTIVFLLDFTVSLITRKSKTLDKLFRGTPLILIADGKINYKSLRKSKLTLAELMGIIRDKDCFDIADIEYGVFETNGKLSLMLRSEQAPATCQDLKVKTKPAVILINLVTDGTISKFGLQAAGLTREKLYKKLKTDPKSIKNILLATIDPSSGDIAIQYKTSTPIIQVLQS